MRSRDLHFYLNAHIEIEITWLKKRGDDAKRHSQERERARRISIFDDSFENSENWNGKMRKTKKFFWSIGGGALRIWILKCNADIFSQNKKSFRIFNGQRKKSSRLKTPTSMYINAPHSRLSRCLFVYVFSFFLSRVMLPHF